MVRSLVRTTLVESCIATVVVLCSISIVAAQARTSPSYQIQSDSINFGGGLSTSTNYTQESTFGEAASGESDSSSYSLRAGYQQMQEVFISMTAPDNVLMEGTLPGITGGESNGSTSVLVITDSPSGYQLTIVAESAPAMQKGVDFIADYVPENSPNADFLFTTAALDAHFGFSVYGTNTVQHFLNDTNNCGVGEMSTLLRCWEGLATSTRVIAQGSGANHPFGATTTIQFKVGIGGDLVVTPGTYVATTTLTALPL